MSHIADVYNNGRCGQLRTIENARGAFADLIRKEALAADSADRRQVLLSMNIRCPRCALQVAEQRCRNCCYYPVPLPPKAVIDQKLAEMAPRRATTADTSATGRPGSRAAAAVTTLNREGKNADDSYLNRDGEESAAAERLEQIARAISDEQQQQAKVLERVRKLSAMVEAFGNRVK